ncbi:MAG: tetratricopeptide repeat protein [Bacteroidota bacterium]
MKIKLFLYLLFFFSIKLFSQVNIDSLYQIAIKEKNDTAKIRMFADLAQLCDEKDIPQYANKGIQLAEQFIKSNVGNAFNINNLDLPKNLPEKTKQHLFKYYGRLLNSRGVFELGQGNNQAGIAALEKSLKAYAVYNDTIEMAVTLSNIGINLFYLGDTPKSTKAISESLKLFTSKKDKKGIIQCYNAFSIIARTNGDILGAIDYIFKSLKMSEASKDSISLANLYNNLSVFYLDVEDFEKAEQYALKSLEISSKIKEERTQSNAYNNLSFIYKKQGNIKKSYENLYLSTNISEKLGDKNQLVSAYSNIGVMRKDEKKYSEAIEFYDKSLKIATEINSIDGIANANYKLGEVYSLQNNNLKAQLYAEKSLQLSQQINSAIDIKNSAGILKDIYEKNGQYQKAIMMANLFIKLKDSILSFDKKREITRKEIKYNYDKKILADSIKNTVQKKLDDAKIELQKTQIEQQKSLRKLLLIGIGIVFILLIYTINRLLVNARQKKIIQNQTKITEQQKNELELKNKNIQESIEAAKDIQVTIFPNQLEIASYFKDQFLVLQPLDNLSGDFFWIKKINSHIIIVIGDCTGHGIPGSMLTLLANEFLNKIIVQNKHHTPLSILSELNKEVNDYLKRKNTQGRFLSEGMDVAICSADMISNKLTYAGLNINLHLSDNDGILQTIHSSRGELGRYNQLSNITEHNFNISSFKGFYLSTDGLKDQLKYRSNASNFGYNGFESFLSSVQQESFMEQSIQLKKLIQNACTKEKQIDDILVFGFKL